MRIPQPVISLRVPLQPVQALRSGRGGEIDVPYIRCLDGRVPKSNELGLSLRTEFVRFTRPLELDSLKISGKILFTPTSSLHDDYRFLSRAADPCT